MKNSKKIVTLVVAVAGLMAMLIAPAGQADGYYRHHWHRAGRSVQYRGCRRIVRSRFCKINRFGERHCYIQRHVRWVC